MSVIVYSKTANDFASVMAGLQAVDGTRFIYVWADSGVLKGRIGTVNTTTGVVTFGADQTILTLPNYGAPGTGRPSLVTIAVLSTTKAALQWTDGYRTYYFTPLTLNLATGSITAGSTTTPFGLGTYDNEANSPSGFCKYDATHYCATVRNAGLVVFGVMDDTCTIVGTPINVSVGLVPEDHNVIAMDAALTQFLPFTIDYAIGAYDPYVGMVTPGSPPVKNNAGVVGPNKQVTQLKHIDDTHSFFCVNPTSTTVRVATVIANGGTHAITVTEDALVINLTGVTNYTYPSTIGTTYPARFDVVMIDATHAVLVGACIYAPSFDDSNYGRYILRTFYWTLGWDGTNWSLVAPDPIVKELDAAPTGQNNMYDWYTIAMGTSGITVTMWNQQFSPGGAGSPKRIAVYSPYFDVLAPPRSLTPAAALRTAHVFGPRVLDPTAQTGQLTAELYHRAAPTVKVATL